MLTTPALALLKQFRPDLRVAVNVEDRFRAIFDGNPDIERTLPPALAATALWRADLCLNVHGGTRSIVLTLASGARFRAGFGHFRGSFAYNVRIPRAQVILGVERTVHTAEHLASAMFYLGAPVAEIPRARLYLGKQAEARAPYAVLHPVASAPDKTWPAENFLEIAAYLNSQAGLEPVFAGSAEEDLSAFAKYRTLKGSPLEELKRLLAGAALFVGNDSGPAHMAAAFGLPVVVLFGASDRRIWSPWRTSSETLFSASGIGSIAPRQVIDVVERLRVKA